MTDPSQTQTCSLYWCTRRVHIRKCGLCAMHYKRLRKWGSVHLPPGVRASNKPVTSTKRTCSLSWCTRPLLCNELCSMHNARLQKHGSVDKPRGRRRFDLACEVPGCTNHQLAVGRCEGHYKRFKKYGEDYSEVPLGHYAMAQTRQHCSVDACDEPARTRYLCATHYRRWIDNDGDIRAEVPIGARPWAQETCSLDDCERPHAAGGLCMSHYLLEREALKRQVSHPKARVSPESRNSRFAFWGSDETASRCYICGGPGREVDHVIPLANGGRHMPANIRPACRSCNSRKGNRIPWRDLPNSLGLNPARLP